MKFNITILLLTLFILHSYSGMARDRGTKNKNYIDSISDAEQIESLIAITDSSYRGFKINIDLKYSDEKCQNLADSLKIQPWKKVDLDNNGLTDLIVIGDRFHLSVLVILDKGHNQYEIKPLTRRIFADCTFPIAKSINDVSKIEYYFQSYPEYGKWEQPRRLEKAILVYKFDDFIEENVHHTNHKIEQLEYSTTGCEGTCPIFDLTINSDKSITWNAEVYNEINNKEVKGIFKTRIDDVRYNEIVNLINYMGFENLKEKYEVDWSDDQTGTLKITYDGGKTKTISDYGLQGTFGLRRLYQMLFALRENQKWVK